VEITRERQSYMPPLKATASERQNLGTWLNRSPSPDPERRQARLVAQNAKKRSVARNSAAHRHFILTRPIQRPPGNSRVHYAGHLAQRSRPLMIQKE